LALDFNLSVVGEMNTASPQLYVLVAITTCFPNPIYYPLVLYENIDGVLYNSG